MFRFVTSLAVNLMLNVKYQTLQLCDDQIVVIVLITFVDRIDSLKNMDDTSRYREFYDLKKNNSLVRRERHASCRLRTPVLMKSSTPFFPSTTAMAGVLD